MSNPHRIVAVLTLFAALLTTGAVPRAAHADVSSAVLALAGPLAEQFGVSASSVTSLLESGLSLDSVTQLLLVSQSSEKGLDDVKSVYDETNGEIGKTASKLKVAAADYSPEKVSAAIDEAKVKAQADATEKVTSAANDTTDEAASAANDASNKAANAANDAVGSALGGFNR